MSSRSTNGLKEPFKQSAIDLVAKANAEGIPAFITDTTRDLAEQKRLVAEGKSWTLDSKHLTGEAVDIAFLINKKLSYSAELYKRLYQVSKGISYIIWPYEDLDWGIDKPHFQYDKSKTLGYNNEMSEEQKNEYEQKIRELNTEIGIVTADRDRLRDIDKELSKEKEGHVDTLEKYQAEQRELERSRLKNRELKKKYNTCIQNKFSGMSLIELIKFKLKNG